MEGKDQEKILRYEHFLNDELREELRQLSKLRDGLYEELAQYYQLKVVIENILKSNEEKTSIQTQVNLGCNFYVQAVVDEPAMINISIGYGFFAELTHQEAINFIDKKTSFINNRVQALTKDMAEARSKMRMVVEALRELLEREQ